MGDVLTLVEKASKQFEGQDLANLEQRIKKNKFTLLDFQKQLEQIQKMGKFNRNRGRKFCSEDENPKKKNSTNPFFNVVPAWNIETKEMF